MKNSFPLFLILILSSMSISGATLKPENVDQAFVQPETSSTFRFQIVGDGTLDSTEFRVLDANGKQVRAGSAKIDGRNVSVTDSFSQGFWELEFPAAGQRFGIVSLPAFQGERDEFFAIDGALSWLVKDDGLRKGLVQSARRVGIGMIRERLSWGAVERKEGEWNWNADRRYDSVRNLCRENGIEVLELFHDAPAWIGKIEKYPDDLVKTARSWGEIGAKWKQTWGALEVWNEPEISFGAELPADQYVPMVRAVAWQRNRSFDTPIFGGVVAHYHPNWLRCAAENGLLRDVEGFSFHTYAKTPSVEKLYGDFRDWLADSGAESLPLWLTKCGRPWKIGPQRPPVEQDIESAVDITMKGIEAKACGIERYFPFVYPYYEERESNFGMMDKLGTPCRSMAAYVNSIRLLSDAEYAGDLKLDPKTVLRARVFQSMKKPSSEVVVAIYTASFKESQTLTIPGKISKIESAFGSEVKSAEAGKLAATASNLYYVRIDRNSISELMDNNTEAMRQLRLSRKPKPARKTEIPPVVIRFQYDKSKLNASPDGYFIPEQKEKELPLNFRVFNLDSPPKKISLRFELAGKFVAQQEIDLPASGFADAVWRFPIDQSRLATGVRQKVRVFAADEAGSNVGLKERPLTLYFQGEATWDGAVSAVKSIAELPVGNLKLWHKNAPAICTMDMEKPQDDPEAAWRMTATFKNGDRWVYPRFALPENIDLSKGNGKGLLVWGRCIGKAVPRVFLFEKSGAGYLAGPIFKDDGQWHVVKLPYEMFQHNGSTRPDDNGKLDPDQVRHISFGANSSGDKCVLELKKIAIYEE